MEDSTTTIHWGSRLLLLCACCSLDTHPLTGVNAQNVLVSITKIHPVDDPKEGDSVILQCTARDLPAGYTMEWTRTAMGSRVLISQNGTSFASRYIVFTAFSSSTNRTEDLNIYGAYRNDTGLLRCLVKDAENHILHSDSLFLSVLYFPADNYPICVPDGPFTVREGTTQNMSCTTDVGNPQVHLEVIARGKITYVWIYSVADGEQGRLLQLNVTAADNGRSYECKITSSMSFPGMEQSCIIGPVTVLSGTTPSSATTEKATQSTDSPTTDNTTAQPSTSKASTSLPIAVIAGAAGGGGCLLFVLILIAVCVCRYRIGKKQKPLLVYSTPLPELKNDTSTQSFDTHVDAYPTSSSSFKSGQEEMAENAPVSIMHPVPKLETHLSTPWAISIPRPGAESLYANPSTKNTHMLQHKGNDITAYQDNPSTDIAVENPRTTEGQSQHIETIPSDKEEVRSLSMYAKVQKPQRLSQADGKKKQSITDEVDSGTMNSLTNHHETSPPEKEQVNDAPMYAEVQKPRRLSQADGKEEQSITDGQNSLDLKSPDEITNQTYINLTFTPDDGDTGQPLITGISNPTPKPTAKVKPITQTPKPQVAPKPGKDHQSLTPKSADLPAGKKPKVIKKYTPKSSRLMDGIDPDAPFNPPPTAASLSPSLEDPAPTRPSQQQPPPHSKDGRQMGASANNTVEENGGYSEGPGSHQDADERPVTDDHGLVYAELDLQPDTSATMPEPEEESTLYASIR